MFNLESSSEEVWPIIEIEMLVRDGELGRSLLIDHVTIFENVKNFDNLRLLYSKNNHYGSIRGMHFQLQELNEWKLVTCLQGTVFDVVIDVRPNSKNFGRYKFFTLSELSNKGIIIPPGFAHGYQSLSSNTILGYLLTGSASDKPVLTLDPLDLTIGIPWPDTQNLKLEKSENYLTLRDIVA